ncbi:FKBP-type peptidyl-prolyl cis-trans isomerase [Mucilaginibacter sp. HMF5004]|uniref:FKBP-type peptidyl-prolyl cis-trans isomerase n=1 Tax=Mucilaginibacter rivuli TaxID=2857527 RepID=UPI001C5F5DBD|nr:FKBP-type peptidyl-prolyl cis-trans isomerase [Mucilaginibacter rivuli]MBW4888636.1 FKBP-type peptidyl-prolyl cis-trans isomerase [Mucilaginibacter rivuli]
MGRILLFVLFCAGLASCGKVNTDLQLAQQQLGVDTPLIRKYINSNNITGFLPDITLGVATGVYYKIDTLGTGNALFTNSTLITVGYKSSLMGSSVPFAQTGTFHPSFSYGQMILGWQYGIKHIKKGGTVRLLVPSGLAYGPYEQPQLGLPANAILDFTIKLYDINN